MRKVGMKVKKRGSDIPFGVRAIQSGVEVDGIWIARAGEQSSETANGKPAEPSSTASATESEPSTLGKRAKLAPDEDQGSKPNTRVGASHGLSRLLLSARHEQSSGPHDLGSNQTPPLTPSQARFAKERAPPLPQRIGVNEAALRRLDGRSPAATQTVFDPDQHTSARAPVSYSPVRRSTPSDLGRPDLVPGESPAASVTSSSSEQRASLPISSGHNSKASQSTLSQFGYEKMKPRRTRLQLSEEETEASASSQQRVVGQPVAQSSYDGADINRSPLLSPPASVLLPSPVLEPKHLNELRSHPQVNQSTLDQPNGSEVDLERGIMDGEGQIIDTSRFTRQTRRSQKQLARPGEAGRQ
jgi:hypothetical protein